MINLSNNSDFKDLREKVCDLDLILRSNYAKFFVILITLSSLSLISCSNNNDVDTNKLFNHNTSSCYTIS